MSRPRSFSRLERRLDTLTRIFESRPDPRRVCADEAGLHWLLRLIGNGDLGVRTWHIPAAVTRRYASACDFGRSGTESEAHVFLKYCARRAMWEAGFPDAENERACCYGRADTLSRQGNWTIECGNTPIGRLRDAVWSRSEIRFSVLPFQNEEMILAGEIDAGLRAFDFVFDAGLYDRLAARKARAAVPTPSVSSEVTAP